MDQPSHRRTMDYQVHRLALTQCAQAYPLVRDFAERVSLQQWQRFVETLVQSGHGGPKDSESGIVVAERNGYIRGLFTYVAIPDLQHDKVLLVQNFAVVEVIRRDAVSEALLREMARLAGQLSCKAIHALLQPGSEWALLHFQRQGHELQGMSLCRPLLPAH